MFRHFYFLLSTWKLFPKHLQITADDKARRLKMAKERRTLPKLILESPEGIFGEDEVLSSPYNQCWKNAGTQIESFYSKNHYLALKSGHLSRELS